MIHFDNDIEELQQWDQQVKLVAVFVRSRIWRGNLVCLVRWNSSKEDLCVESLLADCKCMSSPERCVGEYGEEGDACSGLRPGHSLTDLMLSTLPSSKDMFIASGRACGALAGGNVSAAVGDQRLRSPAVRFKRGPTGLIVFDGRRAGVVSGLDRTGIFTRAACVGWKSGLLGCLPRAHLPLASA